MGPPPTTDAWKSLAMWKTERSSITSDSQAENVQKEETNWGPAVREEEE